MAKTLSFTDMSPRTVKIGDTTTSFTLICGNDNGATDLTNATSITVKLGNASGYLKSATVDSAKLTDPTTGQVTVKFNADLMTSLPAGSYAIEVWVVDNNGTSIYPSDGSTGFTITNNIQSANGSTITTITFDDFVEAMNKAASTIAKGDTGTVDNAGLTTAPAFVELKTQVDNSAVGTNLLTGTSSSEHPYTGDFSTIPGWANNPIYDNPCVVNAGSTYTYSIYLTKLTGSFILGYWAYDSNKNYTTWISSGGYSSSGKTSWTFTVPSGVSYISPHAVHMSDDFTCTAKGEKLELGSHATDWCPNPSEILTQSDYAKLQAAIVSLGGHLS
ncbi:collagen-like protein [Lactiplantibacillus plantarum]|nr:collagen-like protein [Lactiplantibacillus plantarum]